MSDALTMAYLIAETETRFDAGKLEIIYARRDGDVIYCTLKAPPPYDPSATLVSSQHQTGEK